MLKYAPKRLHFSYDTMLAQLAVMDHNTNVGRPQAKTAEGKEKSAFFKSVINTFSNT